MRVSSRSERVPTALIVTGSLMVVASGFEFTVRNASFLFIAGWSMTLLGFVLWAVPAINAYLRRKQRARLRAERYPREVPSGPRRTPPSRRYDRG
jgi:hypothetical protein